MQLNDHADYKVCNGEGDRFSSMNGLYRIKRYQVAID